MRKKPKSLKLDRWTDGQAIIKTDRQTVRQTLCQTKKQMDRQTNKQTNIWTGRQTNRRTDNRQTDRKTDRQTKGQTVRQTASLVHLLEVNTRVPELSILVEQGPGVLQFEEVEVCDVALRAVAELVATTLAQQWTRVYNWPLASCRLGARTQQQEKGRKKHFPSKYYYFSSHLAVSFTLISISTILELKRRWQNIVIYDIFI